MWPFTRKNKERAEDSSVIFDDPVLQALMGKTEVSLQEAMEIPTFAGAVNKICDTISIIPIKLYHKTDNGVEEVDDDRVKLINEDSGDTFDGAGFKKAMVYDYLTNKGAYAFINKRGKRFISLNHVEPEYLSFQEGTDPIFKDFKILVNGKQYESYQFIRMVRRSTNGYLGKSIVEESNLALTVAYKALQFEGRLIKRGGNKKGFLETDHKVDPDALEKLKTGFTKMYDDENESVVILNNGLKFHESSATSAELQLNENKKANATEICKLFGMPPSILTGGATQEEKLQYIQYCIIPILQEFVNATNKFLLLEDEKGSYYFDYDVEDLTRADIKTRYEAYAIGYKNRFLQIGEIREMENLPDIDIPFFMMGLNDVLYDPEDGDIFIPNMNQWANTKDPNKFPWNPKVDDKKTPVIEGNKDIDDNKDDKEDGDEDTDQS